MSYIRKSNEYLINHPPHTALTAKVLDLNHPPLVSFCIPTKNNEETIEDCLKSITEQNYPSIEIIIIDGYSKDKTVEIAKKYTHNIYFDDGTLGSARQKSIDKSKGPVIALFDSDIVIPHADWLNNAIQYFNYDKRVSSVWSLCIAPPNSTKFQYLYQTELHRVLIEDRIRCNRGVFGGGNALFLRSCFEEIGGINENLHWGEDFDWAVKLKARGYVVVFVPDPLYHNTMRSINLFYHKQFAGAKTFAQTGFGLMGLSQKEVIYENYILGTQGMIRGLIRDRETAWLYYPVILFIRTIAYVSGFLKKGLGYSGGA